MRFTPKVITSLGSNDIFVFGSNTAGRHGRGAALQAVKFGAEYGRGLGISGQTFAIPTKDRNLNVLDISAIEYYVHLFNKYAESNPDLAFLVTPVGCGLAGYTPKEIAPLFSEAFYNLDNVILPKEFVEVITS